jgi:hypothetical protein
MFVQHAHHAALVVAQALDVERRGELLLAGEVVVDAADARAGGAPDVRHRRGAIALLGEAGERRLQDLGAAAGSGLGPDPDEDLRVHT